MMKRLSAWKFQNVYQIHKKTASPIKSGMGELISKGTSTGFKE
jgi:hypothetical protein